jgi:hypothetical protein
MGVLVPTGGDRTAIRRTAEFFLASFQVRGGGLAGARQQRLLCWGA